MPTTHLGTKGQPLIAAKLALGTNNQNSQPQADAYIAHTVLSNGYVAYRATLTNWLPDYQYLHRAPCPEVPVNGGEHWRHDNQSQVKRDTTLALLPHKRLVVSEDFPLGSPWPSNFTAKKGHLRDVKALSSSSSKLTGEKERENKAVKETVWWLKFDCRGVPEEMKGAMQEEDEEKERVKQRQAEKARFQGGRMVQRGNAKVWRKEPRFRGSGRVVTLDDPVKDGKGLAFGEQILPSDLWRENRRWNAPTVEEGEGMRMEDIIREELAYTIRTVQRCTPKKTVKKTIKKRVSFKTPLVEEIPYLQPPELLLPDSASDCGLSVGSDSGCEYDGFLGFSEDEAQGWMPVMVREDQKEEEEGWVSLTGSWMMLGGVPEEKKMVKL